MLFPGELAKIQADTVLAACDLSCTISRSTLTGEAQGGNTQIWNVITTTVAGMTIPSDSQLQDYAYEVGSLAVWLVRLPVGTDVLSEDRLTIGTHTLTVNRVAVPRSYAALITVLATEVG